MVSGGQADLGLLLVRLLRTLNSAFEKGNAVYLLWKGAGSRPPFLEGLWACDHPAILLTGLSPPTPPLCSPWYHSPRDVQSFHGITVSPQHLCLWLVTSP